MRQDAVGDDDSLSLSINEETRSLRELWVQLRSGQDRGTTHGDEGECGRVSGASVLGERHGCI